MKQKTYEVVVRKTYTAEAVVRVTALTEHDAEERALEAALDCEFRQGRTTEYTVEQMTEI